MKLNTRKILGVNVTISSVKENLEEIWKYFGKTRNPKPETRKKVVKPLIIFTPNPEIISYAQKNVHFKQLVNTAQINLPDGAGAVWAVKKLYGEKIEKIAGVDFMLDLVKLAAKESLTIGLIGGKGDLAVRTTECLLENHPNLKIEVFDAPEVKKSKIKNQKSKIHIRNQKATDEEYIKDLTKDIANRKVNILFVALGFPKQEYFIDLVRQQLKINNYQSPIVLMAVGGAFDFLSGRVPRAPRVLRNLGLEWLFRLLVQPSRLTRQLKGAAFFVDILTSG